MTLDDLFAVYNELSPENIEVIKTESKNNGVVNFYSPLEQIDRVRNVVKTNEPTEDKKEVEEPSATTFNWNWNVDGPKEFFYDLKARYLKQPNTNVTDNLFKLLLSNNDWVNAMVLAYKKLGLNNNAIKNLLTKNSVESNWGKSKLSESYNFGGITAGKYWTGKIVESGDKDKYGNSITLKFRAYDSIDDYVKDEVQFLTRLYDFDLNDNIDLFLDKLQGENSGKRKYAENPKYKEVLKHRYNTIRVIK